MTTKNHQIVCIMFFMRIVSMWWFFMHIVSFKTIFSMKRGYVYVWETCEFCGCVFQRDYKCYCFLSIKKGYENIFRFVSILF